MSTWLKNAEEKATALLVKQVTARAQTMFCVLVIVGGFLLAVTESPSTATNTVSLLSEVVSCIGGLSMLFVLMVCYKKLNNIKVIW